MPTAGRFFVQALQDYAVGEQVFLNYGNKAGWCDRKWLTSYGYVDETRARVGC